MTYNVFNIDNDNNMFLEHKIHILEQSKKDHVTLKTVVIAAEKSALSSQE